MTREEFIAGLREAADFLEAHPDLPHQESPIQINVFVNTKEELATLARMGSWQKGGDDNYFYLMRDVGALRYDINIAREKICRRVVTGQEVIPAREEQIVEKVEWVCDEPLFAHA